MHNPHVNQTPFAEIAQAHKHTQNHGNKSTSHHARTYPVVLTNRRRVNLHTHTIMATNATTRAYLPSGIDHSMQSGLVHTQNTSTHTHSWQPTPQRVRTCPVVLTTRCKVNLYTHTHKHNHGNQRHNACVPAQWY